MIRIVERRNAVIEIRQKSSKGGAALSLSMRQLSGRPLTDAQWQQTAWTWAAKIMAAGGDLGRCEPEAVEDDEHE